ncbi:MAG: dodecin family protein [Firmicutes bacterium]|nr:dodecin family protein [Bacillota bacterium]
MHVMVAELVGGSPNSWRDAVQAAITEATQTLGNITGVEVINFTANVENGEIKEYKANVKVAYFG